MKARFTTLFAATLLGLTAHAAHASVVVSNLDPANASFGFNAPTIGQSVLTGNRPISLTSVQIFQQGGFTTGETVSVRSRNADGSVGATLFSGFTLAFDATSTVTTATVSGAFTLQANTGYYFVLTSGTTSNIEWSYTSSTDYAAAFGATLPATRTSFDTVGSSTAYFDLAQGPQEFQVNGLAGAPVVPEPSTYALLGLAMAGGVVVLARRRVAARA